MWHSHILTEADRILLETAPINEICAKLEERFKIDHAIAKQYVRTALFGMQQMARGADIQSFESVIRKIAREKHGASLYRQPQSQF
ncbi:hypothetical protein B0T22DRAFT_483889 [Podospora appendiculata]|uniref:Uncharacterized protein n=1 Tax=Podospora appendiculata TaxID=314037 RepID=A0AAE0X3H9_9PEZI|nr:hypothetical protein B0T22DRAFT_483889 [Podospora appendiculata]